MTNVEDQRLRAGLPITDGVMQRAIVDLCGHAFVEECATRTRLEFVKKGIFGWKFLDANVLLDIIPAPDPYRGQWALRLKTTHITPAGEVYVCEFYLPQSEIDLSKQRSRN